MNCIEINLIRNIDSHIIYCILAALNHFFYAKYQLGYYWLWRCD
jgi:hypothetical protein